MKTLHTISLALILALFGQAASAACYADYKAKRGDPVEYSYGVIELSDALCSDKGAASEEVAARLQAAGWQLLKLQSIFGPEGLDQKKADAGEHFLRY